MEEHNGLKIRSVTNRVRVRVAPPGPLNMNYSAAERYFDDCRELERRLIPFKKIRRRWFRNHYVLYQTRGYFVHKTWAFHVSEVNKNFEGEWYGPFWNEAEAKAFAEDLKAIHLNFVMG